MKRLAVLFVLLIATDASAEQIEKTFTNSSILSRTDACQSARSSAEFRSNYLGFCSNPNVAVGNCECEEVPLSSSRTEHQCLVIAKISCDERSSSGSRSGSSPGYGGHEEVRSFTSPNSIWETQAEACGSAKTEASFWARLNGYNVTRFSSCNCSQTQNQVRNRYTWTCNVDATLRP